MYFNKYSYVMISKTERRLERFLRKKTNSGASDISNSLPITEQDVRSNCLNVSNMEFQQTFSAKCISSDLTA